MSNNWYRETLEKRPDNFERILTKDSMRGLTPAEKRKRRFLLFEASSDKAWAKKKFTSRWKRELEFDLLKIYEATWVFAIGKRRAIKLHRTAIKEGYTISTLVDMDHDTRGKELKKATRIHTTSPACTLATMQFVDESGKLSETRLKDFIRTQLPNSKSQQVSLVADRAVKTTMERLCGNNPYSQKRFIEKGWDKPINDHDLCNAIMKVDNKKEKKELSNAMLASALEDKNGLLRVLFRKMFEDISQFDGPHSRT